MRGFFKKLGHLEWDFSALQAAAIDRGIYQIHRVLINGCC